MDETVSVVITVKGVGMHGELRFLDLRLTIYDFGLTIDGRVAQRVLSGVVRDVRATKTKHRGTYPLG